MAVNHSRPGLIQHEVRPEVKHWIEEEARKLERSQRWFVNKLVEDAFARAKPTNLDSSQPQGAQ